MGKVRNEITPLEKSLGVLYIADGSITALQSAPFKKYASKLCA
jgi:hypothetical protein